MSTAEVITEVTDFDIAEAPAAKMPVVQQPRMMVAAPATPADLVRYALESGADLDRLERLMELQLKWEANQARKAFVEAMAEFKLNPPTIYKDKHVEFRTDKGITAYDHATIGNVVEKVVAALARHGFSHRWIPHRSDGGMISITCVVTHKLGYSEETTLEAGLDQSGGKNNIQAMISTKSYLERHSLLAAVGLATKDTPDDDGATGGTYEQPPARSTPSAPQQYSQESFDKNKASWREIVKSKRKTPTGMIAFIETKGALLTDAQKLTIDSWSHENE